MDPTLETIKAEVLRKWHQEYDKYPQYASWLRAAKLVRIGRNTGARGIRWFTKGDITLAVLEKDGISAFSWYPFTERSIVGLCRLAQGVPVKWLE